jgi:hypothetical protein
MRTIRSMGKGVVGGVAVMVVEVAVIHVIKDDVMMVCTKTIHFMTKNLRMKM